MKSFFLVEVWKNTCNREYGLCSRACWPRFTSLHIPDETQRLSSVRLRMFALTCWKHEHVRMQFKGSSVEVGGISKNNYMMTVPKQG